MAAEATSPGTVLAATKVDTEPIEGQKPGTSGLRKKVKVFQAGNYLHNFVQALFDVLAADDLKGGTLVVSGDGRYWTPEAIQIILKMAAANGVGRVWVGKDGLLSTPAVSAVIREREGGKAFGGIVLTASHNPGGPEEDFGIKYNVANGGPAPSSVTDAIYARTQEITQFSICAAMPDFDISTVGTTVVGGDGDGGASFTVEVIDSAEDYLGLLKKVFDFAAIRALIARDDFTFTYDALNGVAGAYASRFLVEELGADPASLQNCVPKPDFGGGHPDPNLVYAHDLVEAMGLAPDGSPLPPPADGSAAPSYPEFGAAADGDADRNMILGKQFFVTPSDSVAIIAANADAIPFFRDAGGLKAVARSMPTSAALDRVAAAKGLKLFEVPTGWKFFGNLMDSKELGKEDYNPFLCGEESFGTGSNHIREKDGLWAVLAWLSILAARNAAAGAGSALVTVEDVVKEHWATYGRNYYCRYDYEAVDAGKAEELMEHLRSQTDAAREAAGGGAAAGKRQAVGDADKGFALSSADEFTYTDPVDDSVAEQQGLRFNFTDGSRVVFRLSGTGSVGATIRMYLERLELDPAKHGLTNAQALAPVVDAALALCKMAEFTGRDEPSVIT